MRVSEYAKGVCVRLGGLISLFNYLVKGANLVAKDNVCSFCGIVWLFL